MQNRTQPHRQYGTYQQNQQQPSGYGRGGQYQQPKNLPGPPNPQSGSRPYPPPGDRYQRQQQKAPVGVGETPSAPPPMQTMDRIEGYQDIVNPGVSFVPPPPSYSEAMQEPSASPEQFRQGVHITEEEARDCLVKHAEAQCCWGKSAAESMTFNGVESSTAVHYILRTYLETRCTDWVSEPYRGQIIDGPQNGMPPQPWDIQIQTPQWFKDETIKVEVPHTASVKTCHKCIGATVTMCHFCCGVGYGQCNSCSGTGHTHTQGERRHCTWCEGSGRSRCIACHGQGRVTCNTCDGAGRVKCFIRLTVGFKTHTKDFILERTELPDHLIRDVTGTTLFKDTKPHLHPIHSFPEPIVNQQSKALIQQHGQLAQSGRILMQSHVIRGVPVFECSCTYEDNLFSFFVYGNNRKVHAPDYPQTCCCGCQIL